MTTLTDFWPTVPSRSDVELKQYAVVMPDTQARDYLIGQDGIFNGLCKAIPRKTEDGSYIMCADLLREFHPDTATGLYGAGYDGVLTAMADDIQVEDWATTIAKLAPDPPIDLTEPPVWDQPVPGRGRWYDMGYPFNALVKRVINGVEYVRRSVVEFNVWDPAIIDARYWEFDPPQAIPWQAGQVWGLGDVVHHISADLPENDTWRSKINANTTEPTTDTNYYRFWEPIGDTYDPYAPKEFVLGRAYGKDERCIEDDVVHESTLDMPNVWAPSAFPTGWKKVT